MAGWIVAVEGDSDVAAAIKILHACGQEVAGRTIVCGGKSNLDARLPGIRAAAAHRRWLVLRDLDRESCAPQVRARLQVAAAPGFLRIAVRAIEAWLLADREAAALWLGVAPRSIPEDVEGVLDPKAEVIRLACRPTRKVIRQDIVPRRAARVGPGYVDQIRRYAEGGWRPDVAARAAPSLARCLAYVRNWRPAKDVPGPGPG